MKKIATIRSMALLGMLCAASLATKAQDLEMKRLPFQQDLTVRTVTEVQTIEVDMRSIRVQAPRNQMISDQLKATASNTDVATENIARNENIEVNLDAYTRKPIGTTSKP